MLYRKICQDCGHEFLTEHRRRRYCCTRCRRHYQDERRREERAEARAVRACGRPMTDPWNRHDLDDWTVADMFENALLDPLPAGLEADMPLTAMRPRTTAGFFCR